MNKYLMDDLLRKEWGFDGFIVSDATAIAEEVNHGIGDLQEVSARSLQAGLDMDMNSDGYVGTLQKSLAEGRVTEADVVVACVGEIANLNIHGIYATSTRPVKELKGFRKVHLEPGASAQVDFTLTKEDLSYYNHDLQWVCEPGDFEIMIGPNSRDTEGITLRVQ